MSPSKIKVLFHSNHSKVGTGFGKNMRNILLALYNDPEIEVFEAANGIVENTKINTPWKSFGTYSSSSRIIAEQEKNQSIRVRNSYGIYCIEKIVEEIKPDIYIGIEDVWAFSGMEKQPWWEKTKKIIWTTLDSLPVLNSAPILYGQCEKMLVWATFAEKEMIKLGCPNVKTLHGAVDYSQFFPLTNRDEIRKEKNIGKDDFVIGFVFKNQLRKSVPNLIEGFKLFKKKNKGIKAKLLLHTDWALNGKNWDIRRYIQEKNIDTKDVLCTYLCSNCNYYFINPYVGEEKKCPHCMAEKSVATKTTTKSVTESQLNEIYNIMDVYCHPFTSGGQELPIQEAKSAGLITLVTNYSCGEDSCHPHQGGLPLSWHEYREPQTQFIKASTDPESICEQLTKVFYMDEKQKEQITKNGRKNVQNNFDVNLISKKLKKIIKKVNKSNKENIENQGETKEMPKFADLNKFLDEEGKENRIAVIVPNDETNVLIANSFLENIKKAYPNKNIYFSTESKFLPIINSNPYIHKIIPYSPSLISAKFLEGDGKHLGYFDIAFFPTFEINKEFTSHNGIDEIENLSK